MERREHYEPEDIEALLHERGFDELLAEERAFVLRHMSGREEYEAMRALLHRAKDDDRRIEPLVADPSIREQLLTTFRERQVPIWNIWLNSVKAFLVPDRASAFWRPALAVAGILVIVIGGVAVMRSLVNTPKEQLADLEVKNKETPQQPAAVPLAKDEATKDLKIAPGAANLDLASASISRYPEISKAATSEPPPAVIEELKEKWTGGEGLAEEQPTVTDMPAATGTTTFQFDATAIGGYEAADSTRHVDEVAVNYVEREDLDQNASLANATGEVARREMVQMEEVETAARSSKEKRNRANETTEDSRSLAQDGQLLKLLESAW